MTHAEAVNGLAAERYLLGEMTEPEQEAFEAHFFECPECADDIRTAAAMIDAARASRAQADVRPFAPPRPRVSWIRSAVLPWALAASLGAIVVYQALPTPDAPPTLPAALPLAPVTLRQASRGEAATVPLESGATVVTLAVALPFDASGAPLAYELRAEDGAMAASGELAAPPPGSPLLLLVPARLLTPATRYTLVVTGTANAGLTRGEYPFTVVSR